MSRRRTVGIFSREATESYKWLTDFLLGLSFVGNTMSFAITNSSRSFKEDVKKCKFAILYHSKTRGRINVTDVMDSLYDEELEYLSNTLGKSNVIVIIDDLDDSSDEEKERIQSRQNSIKVKAAGLFLFSKKRRDSEMENLVEIKFLIRSLHQIDPHLNFQIGTKALDGWLKLTSLTIVVMIYILGLLYYNTEVIPW